MKFGRVCVVAAHPDDELLGCAGTLAKWAAAGAEIHTLILAEGITSRGPARDQAKQSHELAQLQKCAEAANFSIGVKSVAFAGFPDNRLDGVELLDIVKVVESFIETKKPDCILTHWIGDVNVDHQMAHNAVITAARPLPGSSVKAVLFFETVSSTEWRTSTPTPFWPNMFVDVSPFLKAKLGALSHYQSEMREWPHPRSLANIEYLARVRGASAGFDAAEAYMVGRINT